MYKKRYAPFIILFLIFLLSCIIRWPNMGRSLSKHHEFCTALVLLTMDVWAEKGASSFHYSPIINYTKPADKNINNGTLGFMRKDGYHYYLSHPPMAYILPYFSLSLLQIPINLYSLQLFNLLWHFIGAWFIYLITKQVLYRAVVPVQRWYGLMASTIYLFTPATLWFFSNVYMSDMFVNHFWVISIYLCLKIFQENRQKEVKYLLGLAGIIALTLYTEWIGCFAGGTIGLLALLQFSKNKNNFWVALAAGLGLIIGFGAIIIHYSSILGWEYYFQYAEQRFFTRTGQTSSKLIPYLQNIGWHYLTSYLPFIALCFVLFFISFFRKKNKPRTYFKAFSLLAFLPVLMHNFIFLNYTAGHDFSTVKAAPFLAIATTYGIYLLPKKTKRLALASLFIALLIGIIQYYYINRPGEKSWRNHRYDMFEEVGQYIRKHQIPEHGVMTRGIEIHMQLLYYAKRNILSYEGEEKAKAKLRKYGLKKALVLDIENAEKDSRKIKAFWIELYE